ncbi:hypothetical protein O181_103245 [Austropuccinia psidii MF-1]|uniref:Uncharacterized protein n=1 Tax=Austropuccinia psidii MF-1 TaxID=1389203 RepID=A0A9Q3JL76_9BASI|nr:hypothetical protein [Austropuccinia psidii MF-1]
MTIIYKEGKIHTNADGLGRWPLVNVRSNPAYDPEVAAKIPIHFMEIDRRQNFRCSEWETGSGTLDSGNTDSEGTETPILRISSSELHNEFLQCSTEVLCQTQTVWHITTTPSAKLKEPRAGIPAERTLVEGL